MPLPTSVATRQTFIDNGEGLGTDSENLLEYQKVVRIIPSPPQVTASLDDATSSTSAVELHRLPLNIIDSNDAAKKTAIEWLLTPMEDESTRKQSTLKISGNKDAAKPEWHLTSAKADNTPKRKALKECTFCGKEYRVTEDVVGNCVYHPGRKEKDYESDAFVDCWKSDEEPDPEDPEFQHGFSWSCRDQPGDAVGCVVTKYRPLTTKRRKN